MKDIQNKEKTKKKQFSKQELVMYILTTLYFLYTFLRDFKFFDFKYTYSASFYVATGTPFAILFYIITKAILGILLFGFIRWGSKLIKDVFYGNRERRRQLFITLGIAIVFLIALFLTWPGIWWCNNADEFQLFSFARHLQVQYHQGVVMSVFYILGLMIYPKPESIIVLQIVIGSCVFGWIINDLIEKFSTICGIVFCAIVVNPVTLYFALYPMRAFLFTITLCGLFYQLFLFATERDQLSFPSFIRLSIFAVIAVNIRVETLLLIFFYPFALWLFFRKKDIAGKLKKWILLCVLVMIASLPFCKIVNRIGNQECTMSHSMLSFVAPLADILYIHRYEVSNEDKQNLNEVFDLYAMSQDRMETADGRSIKCSGYERCSNKEYVLDKGLYRNAQLVMVKLFLQYPTDYLINKCILLKETLIYQTESNYFYKYPESIKPESESIYFPAGDSEMAKEIKQYLAGDYRIGNCPIHIVYNAFFWIPYVLLIIQTIVLCLKKKYKESILSIFIILMGIVVFLTAMLCYTMYYFPYIICAWLLVIMNFNIKNKAYKIIKD